MSLTGNLDWAGSDIRQFFARFLPTLPSVSRGQNLHFVAVPCAVDSSNLSPYERTAAGGALDYRVRMIFNPEYVSDLLQFAAFGMGPVWRDKNGIFEKLLAFQSLTTDERRLCQIAIIFAFLDIVFRSGMESETLKEIGSTNIELMLDRLNPELVGDVVAQSQHMQRQPFIANAKNFVLGPTFDGSLDVGGADADLIVDGLLVDFKSTMRGRLKAEILRQLIGYWLLDYSDRYAIRKVGVYFSRYGVLWAIDVNELLHLCGLERGRNLRDLWAEDRAVRREAARKAAEEAEQGRKAEARKKRKLAPAKRQWRLIGARAFLAEKPPKRSKLPDPIERNVTGWDRKHFKDFSEGKTDLTSFGHPLIELLDWHCARLLGPFDDWLVNWKPENKPPQARTEGAAS